MIAAARRVLHASIALVLALGGILASSPQVATAADATFYITGRGWGHAIGLSQEGAYGLAQRVDPNTGSKYTAEGIIRYYFGNTTNTKVEAASTHNLSVLIDPNVSPRSSSKYSRSSWQLRSGRSAGSLRVVAGNLPSGATLPSDAYYTFKAAGSGIQVYSGSTLVKPGGVTTLTGTVQVTEAGQSSPLVQVYEATGIYSRLNTRYRGSMQLTQSGGLIKLVNRLNLEDYLYGVVPREVPASWASSANAALQAQAIAARSYVQGTSTEIYTTTYSQAYQGHSGGSDRTNVTAYEDSRSNAAVDATNAKVVYYYSSTSSRTLVKTYFSSASGGHTANIEDVWTSSAAQPYYKGVPDPDQASPYYESWGSPVAYSGTSLAAKLRAYSATYSVPSPATVTNVEITRASNLSGFAVSVKTTWSTGATRTMPGSSFQSALGLRSTKFSVGRNTVPEPPAVGTALTNRFEQSDAKMLKLGSFVSQSSSSFSGGSQVYSETGYDRFHVQFNGTGARWIATRGVGYGKANVYVDGVYKKNIDLYSATSINGATVYSVSGLPKGSHTLSILVLDTRNAASKGDRVSIDAIDVEGELEQATEPFQQVDQTDPRVAYVGTWTESAVYPTGIYGGTHSYSTEPSATAYASFTGTGFEWKGCGSVKHGIAEVSVDGAAPARVDLYSDPATQGATFFSVRDLPRGPHTVAIRVTGDMRDGATGSASISLDELRIYGGGITPAAPPKVRVDDTDPAFTSTGTWSSVPNAYYNEGFERRTAATGATMSLRFDGTSASWIGTKAASFGKANVYLDGKYVKTVDCYSPTTIRRTTILRLAGLPSGRHTLTIRALGVKRATAKGTWVSVDASDVYGRPAALQ